MRAKRALEAGMEVAPAETTLADAITLYVKHLGETGRRASTCAEAGYRLNPLIEIVGGVDFPLEDLSRVHVEKRLAAVASVAGRKGTLGRLRAFCQWAVKQRLAYQDATKGIVVLGKVNRGKTTLTRVEARKLNDTLWQAATGTDKRRADASTALLLELSLGLRRGEVVGLRVRDLDLAGDPPVLSVEYAKTASGVRDTELTQELAALLRPRVAGKELTDSLWPASEKRGGQHGRSWLKKWVKLFCREAGVPEVCQHGLRGTHARLSREAGTTASVVAAQLGHTNERVTVESYIGSAVEERQRGKRALKVLRGGH